MTTRTARAVTAAVVAPRAGDPATLRFSEQVKQNLDVLTGQHANATPLGLLPNNATMEQMRVALNVIITRMGGR